MLGKLYFASAVTLSLLFSFVFFLCFSIAYFYGAVRAETLILSTLVINIFIWLLAPALMD